MCSITNDAHARTPPATRAEVTRGAGQRSRIECDVYLLSCLYVVGRHSLVITVLRRKGAVIRERSFKIFIVSVGGNSAPSVNLPRRAHLAIVPMSAISSQFQEPRIFSNARLHVSMKLTQL